MGIIVTGYGEHGKDTVCEMLEAIYGGLRYASSSRVACELFIYKELKDRFGYKSIEQCYEDRRNMREIWYRSIVRYNTPDKARLAKELFAKYNVYCGLRDREELNAIRDQGLARLVIWVDASSRLGTVESGSMNIDSSYADIVIENNHCLDALECKVRALGSFLGYNKAIELGRMEK